MLEREFRITVPAKWVLAGEHAVGRNGSAVVFPYPDRATVVEFEPSRGRGLRFEPQESEETIRALLDRHAVIAPGAAPLPAGCLRIRSSIPPGAGLGSSAALCFAVASWLSARAGAPREVTEIATRLEDRFHGRSSGMDVAAVSGATPILYSGARGPRPLPIEPRPRFTLHDTGLRASTRASVEVVQRLAQTDPFRAKAIDSTMSEAAIRSAAALEAYACGEVTSAIEAIGAAMRDAQGCFENWGLVPDAVRELCGDLVRRGAQAAKLTGAGGGGFVVALWGESR